MKHQLYADFFAYKHPDKTLKSYNVTDTYVYYEYAGANLSTGKVTHTLYDILEFLYDLLSKAYRAALAAKGE